jgi:hypothetical protein
LQSLVQHQDLNVGFFPYPRGSRLQGNGEMAELLAATSFGESAHDAPLRSVSPRPEPLTPRTSRPFAAAGRAFTVSLMLLTSVVVDRAPTPCIHVPLRSLTCGRSPKSSTTRRNPDDQDRAASNGLVMLELTARDAFCRTECPRIASRVDTLT